jgi:hypothetical protein
MKAFNLEEHLFDIAVSSTRELENFIIRYFLFDILLFKKWRGISSLDRKGSLENPTYNTVPYL